MIQLHLKTYLLQTPTITHNETPTKKQKHSLPPNQTQQYSLTIIYISQQKSLQSCSVCPSIINPSFIMYYKSTMMTDSTQYYSNCIHLVQYNLLMSNTVQQLFPLTHYTDDKDQTSTEADSTIDSSNLGFIAPIVDKLTLFPPYILQQHSIAASVGLNTFNADKMFKAFSSVLKVLKSYNLTPKISWDKLSGEIGQIRRLLRIDRLTMLAKEFLGFFKKKEMTTSDRCMIIFKAMIFIQDLTDLYSYMIQLKVIRKEKLLADLRKALANLYFFECLGWLVYHSKQYFNAKTSEDRYKNKMAVIKYTLDGLIAHNDFSHKFFSIDNKLTSLMSVTSGFLNLYLVWK